MSAPSRLKRLRYALYRLYYRLKYFPFTGEQAAIRETRPGRGFVVIQLDALMDHGPIVAQQKDVILPNDTWITLGNRLFEKGAKLFLTSPLPPLLNQERGTEGVRYKPQNEAEASFTQKITRQSGFIEFEKLKNYLDLGICELDIARMHRAFVGWPGIWSIDPSGKRVKLVSLSPVLVQYAGKEPQPWRDS